MVVCMFLVITPEVKWKPRRMMWRFLCGCSCFTPALARLDFCEAWHGRCR